MQPIGQQRLEARIVQLQQIDHMRQGFAGIRRCHHRGDIKAQFGRRGIARESAYRFKPPHFQRGHALAQRGFQGVFPAILHVQARPQLLHVRQAVLL